MAEDRGEGGGRRCDRVRGRQRRCVVGRRARRGVQAGAAGDVRRAGAGRRTGVEACGGARRPQGTRAPAVRRLLDIFRERLVAAEKIDFFGSAGRDRVLTVLRQLEDRIGGTGRQPAPPARGTLRKDGVVSGPPVDHAASARRRSHGLRLADPSLHRSSGALRLRRRPGGGAGSRRAVRHVRRRVQSPGRRLHLRNAVLGLRHRRTGALANRGDRPRPGSEGRPVWRAGVRHGRRA